MSAFRLDPAIIAELVARYREEPRLAPLSTPVLVDNDGYAWLPAPSGADEAVGMYVHPGLRVGFVPMPEADGLILIQWGGPAPAPGFEEEGVVAFLTRAGFDRLITDLQAVAATLTTAETHLG